MSSRRFRGLGRLKVKLLVVAAVGSPPVAESPAANVYSFAMAAPSPLMQAGFMTLGPVKKVPPQLVGITAGCLSTRPAPPLKTSVKSPPASAAVGNVSCTDAAVSPG